MLSESVLAHSNSLCSENNANDAMEVDTDVHKTDNQEITKKEQELETLIEESTIKFKISASLACFFIMLSLTCLRFSRLIFIFYLLNLPHVCFLQS